MDFPKKQAQRLMPLYLLEYSEKLFENHPDPEAPWGGGGDYTAGYGISITNSEISVDTTVIATKSDISSMVTTTMLDDALDDYALKTDLPENVSDLNNDAGYITSAALSTVYQPNVSMISDGYQVTPFYSGIEYEYADKKAWIVVNDWPSTGEPTIAVENHSKTHMIPGKVYTLDEFHQGGVELTLSHVKIIDEPNHNFTTLSQGKLMYEDWNGIRNFNLNSTRSSGDYTLAVLDDIPSLSGYATESWVNNQGFISSTDLSNYVTSSELSNQLSNYALSSTVTNLASQVTTLESLVSNHTTQINSINSNITDLQTLTSTHTSQISGINSSITSLESLVNTNISSISTIQNNLNSLGSQVTTLEGLVSANTSNISALQSSVSNCVTLSQLSTTLSDYALKSEVPSVVANPATTTQTLSALEINGVGYSIAGGGGGASYSLSKTFETWTFTLSNGSTITKSMLMDVSLIES